MRIFFPSLRQTRAIAVAIAMTMAAIFPAATVAEVTVFAAASLKGVLDELAQDYSESPLRIAYGGSSSLARQIRQGAPADIFVSANTAWMDTLAADGILTQGSRLDLVGNRLALIAAPDSAVDLPPAPSFDLLGALGEGHLAMALVKAVPGGIYGREALQSLGVWDGVQSKVVQTNNVRAALRLVETSEAPLGIVYATDLGAAPNVRLLGLFPENSHSPIHYPIALITPTRPEAQAAYEFLTSDHALTVFARHGFTPLDQAK